MRVSLVCISFLSFLFFVSLSFRICWNGIGCSSLPQVKFSTLFYLAEGHFSPLSCFAQKKNLAGLTEHWFRFCRFKTKRWFQLCSDIFFGSPSGCITKEFRQFVDATNKANSAEDCKFMGSSNLKCAVFFKTSLCLAVSEGAVLWKRSLESFIAPASSDNLIADFKRQLESLRVCLRQLQIDTKSLGAQSVNFSKASNLACSRAKIKMPYRLEGFSKTFF